MSDVAIRVEGLGKRYRIGKRERYKTLRDTLTDTVAVPFRCLQSMRRHGGDEVAESPSALIWALRDVSFEVPQGAVLGVIGRNGAGKSTLLKILSRITEPTEGRVEIHGRVGSLLEVGTGFHPELTGRENVFLNGAILGMRKAEVTRRFDEIVAFAEVEKFIDTPVKHFSSGMYMRLAFAIAAHLDPEILVVDEVLAVGDAQFQRRCLGKMGDVARRGRTVLLVSHNLAAVQSLCSDAIWIDAGRIREHATPSVAIRAYLTSTGFEKVNKVAARPAAPVSPTVITSLVLLDGSGVPVDRIGMNETLTIAVGFRSCDALRPIVGVVVKTADGSPVFGINNRFIPTPPPLRPIGTGVVKARIERLQLMPGEYILDLYLGDDSGDHDIVFDAVAFEVLPTDVFGSGKLPPANAGPVFCSADFQVIDCPSLRADIAVGAGEVLG